MGAAQRGRTDGALQPARRSAPDLGAQHQTKKKMLGVDFVREEKRIAWRKTLGIRSRLTEGRNDRSQRAMLSRLLRFAIRLREPLHAFCPLSSLN